VLIRGSAHLPAELAPRPQQNKEELRQSSRGALNFLPRSLLSIDTVIGSIA